MEKKALTKLASIANVNLTHLALTYPVPVRDICFAIKNISTSYEALDVDQDG